MAKKHEESLFVRLNGSEETQKEIMDTLKSTIDVLHHHEQFKSMRNEKAELLSQLKKEMSIISRSMSKLKSILPKQDAKLKNELKKLRIKKEPLEQNLKSEPEAPLEESMGKNGKSKKITDEIAKLEAELNDVESKLNSFNQQQDF